MGCSQSLNSEIQLDLVLNPPVFKTSRIQHSTLARTSLRDLCKQIISLHQESSYKSQELSYKLTFRNKSYSINDCISLYDLRISPEETIQLTGCVLDNKRLELTLKICYQVPKTIVSKYTRCTLVKELLDNEPGFRFIRGNIELDQDLSLEDYEICNKSKLIVLVPGSQSEDVQVWKIKKSGLVLEANCMNPDCAAYKQRICLNLGIGEFDLVAEMSVENERKCLNCKETLGGVSKIGFCHCRAWVSEGEEEKRIEAKDYVEYPLTGEKMSLRVKTEQL